MFVVYLLVFWAQSVKKMLLELNSISVPPGHKVVVQNVSWQEFEDILAKSGKNRAARIAYSKGILEIMTPLPEHETTKLFITDFVEMLLEGFNIEFYSLSSTTFKNELIETAIELDNCFYIENEAKVRGKNKLDLTIDIPPDLALAVEVTSRTYQDIYAALGVSELWHFEQGKLQINVLQEGKYVEVEFSPHFSDFPLQTVIPDYITQVKTVGRNKAMRSFRGWLRSLKYYLYS